MAGRRTHPASHEQLAAKLCGRIVEGELLAAQVVDRRVALQVEEQVVGETDLPRFLLEHRTWNSISSEQEARALDRIGPSQACPTLPISPAINNRALRSQEGSEPLGFPFNSRSTSEVALLQVSYSKALPALSLQTPTNTLLGSQSCEQCRNGGQIPWFYHRRSSGATTETKTQRLFMCSSVEATRNHFHGD